MLPKRRCASSSSNFVVFRQPSRLLGEGVRLTGDQVRKLREHFLRAILGRNENCWTDRGQRTDPLSPAASRLTGSRARTGYLAAAAVC